VDLQTDDKIEDRSQIGHFFDPYGLPMDYIAGEIAKLALEMGASHTSGDRFKITVDIRGDFDAFRDELIVALDEPQRVLIADNLITIYNQIRLVGYINFAVL
jgi:hypothetical protein